jgi:site-specific recombinase XerD
MRRADLFGLKVEDVDLEHNIAVVLGKGRRLRSCPLGKRMAQAVDRYYPRERPTSMLPARTVACA